MRVMGIDLGTRKVAYSLWEDDVLLCTEAYESQAGDRPTQLMDCADFIYEAASNLGPDLVLIEDTLIGNNRKYSIKLSQMMGAVMYTLELARRSGDGYYDILTVNVSTWKKDVVGSGKADKEAVRNYLWSYDSAYSALCGHDQDRFDAACIGYYGLLLSRRAETLLEEAR